MRSYVQRQLAFWANDAANRIDRKKIKGGIMNKYLVVALLSLQLVACSSAKPPPAWPDGTDRPINVRPVTKPGV